MLRELSFAPLGHLYDSDVMCFYSVILYGFSCHIEGIMRCINFGWSKYDITDGPGVNCTVRHCSFIKTHILSMSMKRLRGSFSKGGMSNSPDVPSWLQVYAWSWRVKAFIMNEHGGKQEAIIKCIWLTGGSQRMMILCAICAASFWAVCPTSVEFPVF